MRVTRASCCEGIEEGVNTARGRRRTTFMCVMNDMECDVLGTIEKRLLCVFHTADKYTINGLAGTADDVFV